jgi:hypothetical protein
MGVRGDALSRRSAFSGTKWGTSRPLGVNTLRLSEGCYPPKAEALLVLRTAKGGGARGGDASPKPSLFTPLERGTSREGTGWHPLLLSLTPPLRFPPDPLLPPSTLLWGL